MNYQKTEQILRALSMTEQVQNEKGQMISQPLIAGDEKRELVEILINEFKKEDKNTTNPLP